MSPVEVALALADQGWFVFPARDKVALIKWGDGASTDPEQIATWWGQWPDAQVGYHCGRSRLVVVDVDEKNGVSGSANLASGGYVLPPTFNYATPSGGRHHVYAAPSNKVLTVAKGHPVPGVDIRAGNGYAIFYGKRVKP